jgi:hypothetical protein
LANERLHLSGDGSVTLEFKRPWKDGTSSIGLEPQALLTRLSAIVPPPRRHVTLYFGVLSSHSRWRSRIVPGTKAVEGGFEPDITPPGTPPDRAKAENEPGLGLRSRYIPWHELLRRTFGSEVVCPECGGKLRLVALVKTETTIRTMLAAMHLPTGPPKAASLNPSAVEVEDLDWSGGSKEVDWMD